MAIQLLRLDNDTVINTSKIVQITIVNLNKVRQERRQHHETPEQRQRINNKYWQVSVYLRSGNDGYNPQRFTIDFESEQEANQWVKRKFGSVIVNKL